MNNGAYLQSSGVTDEQTHQKCLAAMKKYEDNHWWEYHTPLQETAYRQLHESVLLIYVSRFHACLEELVGRALVGNELSYGIGMREDFISECDRCYQQWVEQGGA